MPIEMPRGLPFSVDTWTTNSGRKRHHFLTHAHLDHLQGFAANCFYPIYATGITKLLTLRHHPNMEEELFVEIAVAETIVVRDVEGDFSVTALDANHCPGAVMFLFEGEFGNILHTGDCRLSSDCLKKLPLRCMATKGSETRLDYLFLDCTFGRCPFTIPSKESAIRQVINCIWKHPNAPVVYLACDLLGQEEILIQVSGTFGAKIYVDKAKLPRCFLSLSLIAPEILSEDASSRFQVCEAFPRLRDRARAEIAEAWAKLLPEPLFIRPSALRYAHGKEEDDDDDDDDDEQEEARLAGPRISEAEKDESGVWRVCFSTHSSSQELEWALQLLRPSWVISTTPPCRATELEYVKNHCSSQALAAGDGPTWRLLGMADPSPAFSGGREERREELKVSAEGGAAGGYNASLRRLYRSMNVPVPRPLPSLAELSGASKRARVGLR